MIYSVHLVKQAEKDILEIVEFIADHDSPEQADYVLKDIETCLESLAELPERGHYPPELERLGIKDYREIFFKPYRIIYRLIEKRVVVHSVLDGRRDMAALLERRMLR